MPQEEKFGTYTRDSNGSDYAGQRYYGPGTGRFLTADPYRASAGAGDPGSWNRYAYVGGDPINFGDPDGLAKGGIECGIPCVVTATVPHVPLINIIGPRRDPDTLIFQYELGFSYTNQMQIWEEGLDIAVQELNAADIEAASDISTFGDCAWKGFSNHFGLSSAAAVSGVLSTPISKTLVPPYRSIGTPTTKLLSVVGHFIEVSIPRIAVGSRMTNNLLRLGGRVNPILAVGLTAIDAALITKSALECYDEEKAKQKKNKPQGTEIQQ